jgi:multidrug efflux pump subunit AcrB
MVALQDQVAKIIRDDPSVLTATSFNGGSGSQNTGRMFINLKPRDQRKPMKEVVDGLRKSWRRFLASMSSCDQRKTCSSVVVQVKVSTSIFCKVWRRVSSIAGLISCRKNCALILASKM